MWTTHCSLRLVIDRMSKPDIELLVSYPRQRPPLTQRHKEIYAQEYLRNRAPTGRLGKLAAGLESWMHRQVAGCGGEVLEVGAGTLNHVGYEQAIAAYDVVEPLRDVYQGETAVASVRRFYDDISEIAQDSCYDRIVSVAVLEHLTDLPTVVARCGLLLRPGGVLAAGIPTEGGILWGLAWRFTTGLAYRLRTGLDYGILMRHEHINDAKEILSIVEYFFETVTVERFPLAAFHLSFYTSLKAYRPRVELCRDFLASGRNSLV